MGWFRRRKRGHGVSLGHQPVRDGEGYAARIEREWQEDLASVAEVEADETLTPEERMAAITKAMMRNNGGRPHGIRNVWTGHGEPPSGFGYYDVHGRRNR